MRDYGKSDQPEAIDQNTIFQLAGDIVGRLDGVRDARRGRGGPYEWGALNNWCVVSRPFPDAVDVAFICAW
jgi:hypothetical protein